MKEIKIDKEYVATILIELLFEKGLVNNANSGSSDHAFR